MLNKAKDTVKSKITTETKQQVDKKFQEKKNLRHAVLALMIGILTTMGYMVGDYVFSKTLDQQTFIFLGIVLVFLLIVYIGISVFEFNMHYSDMNYFHKIAVPKELETLINAAFEDIKSTTKAKADQLIQQTVDTGIMKYLETTAKYVEAINKTDINPIEQATKQPVTLQSTDKPKETPATNPSTTQ